MKRLLLISMFCFMLIGCGKDKEEITQEVTTSITNTVGEIEQSVFAEPIEDTHTQVIEEDTDDLSLYVTNADIVYDIKEEENGWQRYYSESLNVSMVIKEKSLANAIVNTLVSNNITGDVRVIERDMPVDPEPGTDEHMYMCDALAIRPDYSESSFYNGEVNSDKLHIFKNSDGSLDLVISQE